MAFNVPPLGGRIRNGRRSYSNRSIIAPWGIDVNRPNSYDQTALDIVTKSASGSGTTSKDLKRLLKGFGVSSGAIGRAVDRYLRGPEFDPQSGLNFICSPVPTQHLMGS
ncbi:hypothetical protein ElyMa_001774300 [Elysia marginata]|uniref:Uncharacterized protein n=1 Tax=Elysia marginata TaxID=1093978 RepID=A0AAV4EDF1_9GAST|nr:hypothetical protein ElyMa_001774300 [Elysia marginata]